MHISAPTPAFVFVPTKFSPLAFPFDQLPPLAFDPVPLHPPPLTLPFALALSRATSRVEARPHVAR